MDWQETKDTIIGYTIAGIIILAYVLMCGLILEHPGW